LRFEAQHGFCKGYARATLGERAGVKSMTEDERPRGGGPDMVDTASTTPQHNSEIIGTNLAEDLISLLCWNDQHGKLIAEVADPALFPGEYGMIAERAIKYHKEYQQAPKAHTANLLAPELEAGGRRAEHLDRTLRNMIQTHEQINTEYVMDTLQRFVRTQKAKDAVLRAAQTLSANGKVEDVEKILGEVLRNQTDGKFKAPIKVGDYQAFLQMFSEQEDREFGTGIPLLDIHNAVPARDRVSVLIGVLGTGKSWWFIHLGRQALSHHKRVLHVTLELRDREVWPRYYQSFMAVPSHEPTARSYAANCAWKSIPTTDPQ
jgi:hypothetical protein